MRPDEQVHERKTNRTGFEIERPVPDTRRGRQRFSVRSWAAHVPARVARRSVAASSRKKTKRFTFSYFVYEKPIEALSMQERDRLDLPRPVPVDRRPPF
jgi:hypothetical protein